MAWSRGGALAVGSALVLLIAGCSAPVAEDSTEGTRTQPTAEFDFAFDDTAGTLIVIHRSGEPVSTDVLTVKVDGELIHDANGTDVGEVPVTALLDASELSEGDRFQLVEAQPEALDGATVRIVWTPPGGGPASALGTWRGPAA